MLFAPLLKFLESQLRFFSTESFIIFPRMHNHICLPSLGLLRFYFQLIQMSVACSTGQMYQLTKQNENLSSALSLERIIPVDSIFFTTTIFNSFTVKKYHLVLDVILNLTIWYLYIYTLTQPTTDAQCSHRSSRIPTTAILNHHNP